MKFFFLVCCLAYSFVQAAPPVANFCGVGAANYNAQQQRLNLPIVNVAGQSYQAQLDLLNNKNRFHFQLTDVQAVIKQTGNASFQTKSQLLTVNALCLGDEAHYQAVLSAVPASTPAQFLLKSATSPTGKNIYTWEIEKNKGALYLPDRAAFDALATTSAVSGSLGVQELKFVLVDLDTSHPLLFFINAVATPLHYQFTREVLKRYQHVDYSRGSAQFISDTYFSEDRIHLAGSIVAYDQYNVAKTAEKGVFTLAFWPTDPVPAYLIEQAYRTVSAAMPFLLSPLAYHPVGDTHEQLLRGFEAQLTAKNIRIIHTDDLYAQLDSAVLNKGEAYGRLKLINASSPSPSEDIIAIYTFIPNTLGHVGGIITEQPQTPLSHINLKARQNNTPNAYIKNVQSDAAIAPLINQWVHYTVTETGVSIEPSTEAHALAWLVNKIPSKITVPESDLSLIEAKPLAEIGFDNWRQVGVKAANVAELGKILPKGMAPQGYALPFSMYHQFMSVLRCKNDMTMLCQHVDSLSLYEYIAHLLADTSFNQNHSIREQQLTVLRDLIKHAAAPHSLIKQIEAVRLFWEPAGEPFKQTLRLRSSTNNEDLQGFNGAGLYGSFTHKEKEGLLINSVKQVWASLWNLSAFEERRLHRIEHLSTYMGVLIHPNYGDEQANGVAISKNIYNPLWKGIYVNAQYGELSITNPEPIKTKEGLVNPVPDEFIVTYLPTARNQFAWETLFIRHSTVKTVYGAAVTTNTVLTEDEVLALRNNVQLIHRHFKTLYQGDKNFSMDVEFKITETSDGRRGKLAIKQARPWVD